MFKKLFELLDLKRKKSNLEDNNNIVLYPKIPFYGIKGSIHSIEDAENVYLKVVYNHDGTIDPLKRPIPKKKNKNLCLVEDDYYKDLKTYLEFNHDKYLDYKNNIKQPKLSKKQTKAAIMATTTLSIISFPILLYTSYVGAILEAISLLSLYKTIDIKKQHEILEKKKQFLEEYKQYQKELITYNQNNSKKAYKTIYTEIATKNATKEKDYPKIKLLTKEEAA